MTLEDLKTFDVRHGHQTYQCKIDIFGLRHRWHTWRDRRQTKQDRIDQGIKQAKQAERALAGWLQGSEGIMTRDEFIERLKSEIRSREKP